MRAVRFAGTHDGLSLAWSRTGSGPPLVKAAAWLTHLEYDAESPVWAHWVKFFEDNFDYLRYDERGCGLSDRKTGQLDIDSWTDDLSRVVEASGIPKPFALLAMSQGTGAALINERSYGPLNLIRSPLLGREAINHRASICRGTTIAIPKKCIATHCNRP